MRRTALLGVIAAVLATPALASTPANGLWRTTEDAGQVEIKDVAGAITGRLVTSGRIKADPALRDDRNADPARRGRTLKGLELFSGMTGKAPLWKGKVYNPEDGKTYSGSVRLLGPDTLKLTGCVVAPFCKSQTWTRIR